MITVFDMGIMLLYFIIASVSLFHILNRHILLWNDKALLGWIVALFTSVSAFALYIDCL